MACERSVVVILRAGRREDAHRAGEIAVAAWQRVFDAWRGLVGDEIFQQLWSDWRERKWREVAGHFERSPETTIVAEVNGKVVGFLTYHLDHEKKRGTIGNNAVHPDYQNYGIGTMQCRRAIEIFKAAGMKCATVMTGLDEGHAPARRMYEKVGFDKQIPHVSYYMKL